MINELSTKDKMNIMVALKTEYEEAYNLVANMQKTKESLIEDILYWHKEAQSLERTYKKIKKIVWYSL